MDPERSRRMQTPDNKDTSTSLSVRFSVKLPFRSRLKSFILQLTHLPTYQLTNLPTYPLTNLPTYQLTNLPTYQLTNLPTYQLTNLPTYQLTSLPTYQLTSFPTYFSFFFFPIEKRSLKFTKSRWNFIPTPCV